MSAPNIVNVSTITGKTAVQAVGTSASAIVTNSSSSNKVFTLDVISKPLYLEEGDAIRLTASAASDLEAVCSYEEIS